MNAAPWIIGGVIAFGLLIRFGASRGTMKATPVSRLAEIRQWRAAKAALAALRQARRDRGDRESRP